MTRSLKFTDTGEVRPPMRGERFRNSRGCVEEALFDFSCIDLPIVQMRVIDIPDGHVECHGFLIDDNDPESFSGCDWKPDCPVCHGNGYHAEDAT